MSMKQDLLTLLQRQWCSPLDALVLAHCFSLSQRVGEFKRSGVPIEDRWQALPNGKRVKEYRVAVP